MFSKVTGWHVLAMMIAFFGVTIGVNATMATLAVRSFSGEDAPKSYLQGLHFNQTLDARKAQQAEGWQAQIAATRQSSGAVEIALAVEDRAGQPVTGLNLSGVLRLPATAREDRALSFTEGAAGHYVAMLARVHPAQWDLVVTGEKSGTGDRFEARNRLWIR